MSGLLEVPPLETLRRRRSVKWTAHGDDVIPMSVAEMDFALAEPVRQVLHDAVELSDTGYADVHAVCEAFAGFARETFGWAVDPDAVTAVTDVGVGAVEVLRVLDARRVMVSSPVYPPFFDWVAEVGATLVDVPLDAGARLDLGALEREFAAGGVYLLCNPQNPTGTAHTRQELTALVALAERHGVTVVSDEIHAPLALPGAEIVPLLSLPGAARLAVSLTSGSKAWNLAGLKCALVVGDPRGPLATARPLPADTHWRVGHFGALATRAAYRDGGAWRSRLLATLEDRRRLLGELLDTHGPAGLRWRPPQATYLAWFDCSAHGSGTDVARRLLDGGVAVEPGERFGAGGRGHIRVNFATGPDILTEAVTRIARALR